jgi:hypothetical protein
MKKLIKMNPKIIVVIYLLADIICTGAGMGVPIFCILFGFPLGWYIAKRIFITSGHSALTNSRILKFSALAAAFTFLIMIVIWGPTLRFLFDPTFDFNNFGHPFILYDPKISFIGWLVLMIFISPFLQLLATIFASFITLASKRLLS